MRASVALLIGCAIEAVLLGILWTVRPDPPLGPIDAIVILPQAPALLIGWATSFFWKWPPMTNAQAIASLFTLASPFYALIAYWLLHRWTSKPEKDPTSGARE